MSDDADSDGLEHWGWEWVAVPGSYLLVMLYFGRCEVLAAAERCRVCVCREASRKVVSRNDRDGGRK